MIEKLLFLKDVAAKGLIRCYLHYVNENGAFLLITWNCLFTMIKVVYIESSKNKASVA